MHRCLELARQGKDTGLNPKVGAVLVRHNEIVAEGFHHGWGEAHAEQVLLQDIDVQEQDIMYVNLEPCSHTGKTPPCCDLIIEKGVQTVVYGMEDPNPEVAGKGIGALQETGIDVIGPVLPTLCRQLNRGYISYRERGRPWLTLKSAQTVKGEYGGKITSEAQDAWAHHQLRATHDAILVGVETVLVDDPELTARHGAEHDGYRIVLDPRLRTPLDSKLVTDPLASRTIIVTTDSKQEYAQVLQGRGVRVWEVPLKKGLFDFDVLWKHCLTVSDDFFGITSILVEGGPTTWTTFRLAANLSMCLTDSRMPVAPKS